MTKLIQIKDAHIHLNNTAHNSSKINNSVERWFHKKFDLKRAVHAFSKIGVTIGECIVLPTPNIKNKGVTASFDSLPNRPFILANNLQEVINSKIEFSGIKIYHRLHPNYKKVKSLREWIDFELFEYANANKKAIMLHLYPVTNKSAQELAILASQFKNIRFILPHGGGVYNFPSLFRSLYYLRSHDNIWIDTSFVTSQTLVNKMLSIFPSDRILFGSDLPFALQKTRLNEKGNFIESSIFNFAATFKTWWESSNDKQKEKIFIRNFDHFFDYS